MFFFLILNLLSGLRTPIKNETNYMGIYFITIVELHSVIFLKRVMWN